MMSVLCFISQVDYFNNYLRDPKRPQLPEYPGNKHGGRKDDRPDPYVAAYPQHMPDNRYTCNFLAVSIW